jgi:hypothetical protein
MVSGGSGGASSNQRPDRAKADALVAGFIERAKQINEDDRFVLCVTELRVFGSYIEPDKADLGDVDIAFAVEGEARAGRQGCNQGTTRRRSAVFAFAGRGAICA